jgi:hypothetical protein
MSSSWPGSLDPRLSARLDPDVAATVDTLAAQLQRMLLRQPNLNPGVGGTGTPDMSLGWTVRVNMPAGNVTIANPLNPAQGDLLRMAIVQDSVGGRTVTWGAKYRKNVALSAGANAIDVVSFSYDSNVDLWLQIGAALALA